MSLFKRKKSYVYFVRYKSRLDQHARSTMVSLSYPVNDMWSFRELAKQLDSSPQNIITLNFLHEV